MIHTRKSAFHEKSVRLTAFAVALLMLAMFILTGCGGTGNETGTDPLTDADSVSGNETGIPPDEEYTLERGDGEKQITFYFNRPSGNYSDCDIWLWHDEALGRGYVFHECAYGAKAVVNVPASVSKVGFIVRTGCSAPGGTEWGSATKDATDADRFAELMGDETVYYLKAGDALLYTSEDGGGTLKAIRNIVMGDLAGLKTVKFVLNTMLKVTKDMVKIETEDGTEVGIDSVNSPGGMLGSITLQEALDITRKYTLTIADMDPVVIMPNTYFSSAEFIENYVYDGELGAIFADGNITFRLWAPTASRVVLNLFRDGSAGDAYEHIELTRGEKGVWSYTAPDSLAGDYYTYSVTTALGEQEAVDPYARSAGLNGKRGMILDLDTTDPEGWTDSLFDHPDFHNYTDAVIWEVQIRDFSNQIASSEYKGKYLAFTETGLTNAAGIPVGLDYLKALGITYVHLMPAYDFASVDEGAVSGYNWGYDPQNYNVPEGSYSTDPSDGAVRVKEFKQMVQALHDAGIRVVMDVVYNHTYDANSNLNKVVPYYYYRYNSGTASNGSGCGNETASDHAMYRKYMIDSVVYWMTEYHVDGFRFDLMGLHDTETMKQIEKAVHAINPGALLYGEGWTGGTAGIPASQLSSLSNIKVVNMDTKVNGIAMFNDVLRDAIKGSTDGSDTGFATGAKIALSGKIKFGVSGGVSNYAFSGYGNSWTAYNPTNMINYASAHDNLALWDKICYAYGEGTDTLDARTRRNALAASIVMTSLGVPFMQAGEEMLRSKKNADGTYNQNSYNAGDAVNNLDWESLTPESEQYRMMQYYSGLIAFRKSSCALRSVSAFDEEENSILRTVKQEGALLAFTVTLGEETLLIVYNAAEAAGEVTLPEGSWDLYINRSTAGTTVIESGVTGTVSVEGISCYVYRLNPMN